MFAPRFFKLLLVAISMVYIAQASFVDLHHNQGRLVRRVSPAPSDDTVKPSDSLPVNLPSKTSDSSAAETTAPDSTSDESQPSETSETSSSSDNVPSTTAETTSDAPSTSAPSTTSAPAKTTSSDDSATTTDDSSASSTEAPAPTNTSSHKDKSGDSTDQSKTQKLITSTKIDVVTKTNGDGSKETMTSTSITTSTPGLSSDDSSGSSGMSPKTRNTVIGVVVGIGGFIVLGVLGLVAWRIWGRKKINDEADGLMDFNINNNSTSYHSGYGPVEKGEPASLGHEGPAPRRTSPFQNTLDNYHQPTPVNASSNF
ncbi:hypothetical protein BGZ63DRAFT_421591 [Mariannaea sp. PMI_226]|nr:hypothetical protein BGZ63DRAFT_421591 [Mariannaea sp. PMI_226]